MDGAARNALEVLPAPLLQWLQNQRHAYGLEASTSDAVSRHQMQRGTGEVKGYLACEGMIVVTVPGERNPGPLSRQSKWHKVWNFVGGQYERRVFFDVVAAVTLLAGPLWLEADSIDVRQLKQ